MSPWRATGPRRDPRLPHRPATAAEPLTEISADPQAAARFPCARGRNKGLEAEPDRRPEHGLRLGTLARSRQPPTCSPSSRSAARRASACSGCVRAPTVRSRSTSCAISASPLFHDGQDLRVENEDDPLRDWSPQFEGLVVDQRSGVLFAGQEDVGIWRIDLKNGVAATSRSMRRAARARAASSSPGAGSAATSRACASIMARAVPAI